MKIFFFFLSIQLVMLGGCKMMDKPYERKLNKAIPVYFNQCLLRDCVKYLSKESQIDIILSRELSDKKDIYIDLHLSTRKYYTIRHILKMMFDYIKHEHGIALSWKYRNGEILIYQMNAN